MMETAKSQEEVVSKLLSGKETSQRDTGSTSALFLFRDAFILVE